MGHRKREPQQLKALRRLPEGRSPALHAHLSWHTVPGASVATLIFKYHVTHCAEMIEILEIKMDMKNIPFGATVWSQIEPTEHRGETGMAYWRTQQFDNIRVRLVEYSPGYLADHWCTKGHILFCLEGELHTELADGRTFILTPGVSYQVADNAEPHRSYTPTGVKLFIVD